MNTWTIFCPGPSLKNINKVEGSRRMLKIITGDKDHSSSAEIWECQIEYIEYIEYNWQQSIAVNGAIVKGFKVAYWAMMDPEAFASAFYVLAGKELLDLIHTTKLWIPMNWLTHMHKWAPAVAPVFQMFGYEAHIGKNHREGDLNEETDEDLYQVILKWSNFTIFSAIALAIFKGAQEIRIFGADMSGKGYFREDLKNARINHKDSRWQQETEDFRQLQALCLKKGIHIING